MKCRSCDCEIPPAFVTAIANNSCPGCGSEIMSEGDKSLMDGLADALQRMPNDPQGIASWLLSNYRVIPLSAGKAEPVERFYRPIEKGQQTEQTGELKQADNLYNKFLKRTDFKGTPGLQEKNK